MTYTDFNAASISLECRPGLAVRAICRRRACFETEKLTLLSLLAALVVLTPFDILAAESSNAAPSKLKILSDPCGQTLLTQWQVDFAKASLKNVLKKKRSDWFCEPPALPTGSANAEVDFLDSNQSVLGSRAIRLSQITNFDTQGGKGGDSLSGGWIKKSSVIFQLKIPANERTSDFKWLRVRLQNGQVLGPAKLL